MSGDEQQGTSKATPIAADWTDRWVDRIEEAIAPEAPYRPTTVERILALLVAVRNEERGTEGVTTNESVSNAGGAPDRAEMASHAVAQAAEPRAAVAPGRDTDALLANGQGSTRCCLLGYDGCREDHSAEDDVNVHRQVSPNAGSARVACTGAGLLAAHRCAWFDEDYDDARDPAPMPASCSEEATHYSCCFAGPSPNVCWEQRPMSAEKMTAIERLEALLDEKDAELAAYRRSDEERERDADNDAWCWTKHTKSQEPDGLPVPRLEIRWSRLGSGGEWNWLASYNLVYRHFLGDVIVVPLSATRRGGNDCAPIERDGKVETPFRDGAHIAHEMRHMNLPGYAICEGTITKLEPMDGPAPYEEAAQKGCKDGGPR